MRGFTIADTGGCSCEQIAERFGFQPLVIGLLDPTPFYFYLALESGERAEPLPLPERGGSKNGALFRA